MEWCDWSNETTMEFLRLYEQEPVIWNPKDPQHRSRNCVNEAWDRIQRSLNIKGYTVKELKKKKESLMATFRPLLNKVKNSSGPDEVYTPTWFAFETMARFLHGVYQPRTAINTKGVVVATDDVDEENGEESSRDEETQSIIAEDKVEEKSIIKIFSKNLTEENTFTSPSNRERSKSKRSPMEKVDIRIEDAYNITNDVLCEVPDKDECSLFADLLVTRLRTFNEHDRDVLMHEIDNLVFKARMQQRMHKRVQHTQPLPSTSISGENYHHQHTHGSSRCSTPSRSYHYSQSSQRYSPYLQLSPGHSNPSPNLPNLLSYQTQPSFSLQPLTGSNVLPQETHGGEENFTGEIDIKPNLLN